MSVGREKNARKRPTLTGSLKSVVKVILFLLKAKQKYPDQPGRFAKLLLRLPALRSIGLKCVESMFLFKTVGETPQVNTVRKFF